MTIVHREKGFTLVETMVSILIFGLITLALVPVMAMSVRGTDLGRRATVAKTLAQEAMERARGLPYYVSFGSVNKPVDVLDLYHPAYTPSGVTTLTCTPGSTARGCPKNMPAGYAATFTARFVKGTIAGSGATATESFTTTVVPHTTYSWNGANDAPASPLLELTVSVSWSSATGDRFELRSILGDRKFTGLKMSGAGKVDHGIKVLTHFTHPTYTAPKSTLVVADGTISAGIEAQDVATATLSLQAADLHLNEVAATGAVANAINQLHGASVDAVAPPGRLIAAVSAPGGSVNHPGLTVPRNVAGADASTTEDLQVAVSGELPLAKGTYLYTKEQGVTDLWATNDVDQVNAATLRLDPLNPIVMVRPHNSGSSLLALKGSALAESRARTAPDRQVHTNAAVEVRHVGILPTAYIPASSEGAFSSVVIVDSFTAAVDCKATGSAASATATATWALTLRVYQDSNPADNVPAGAFVTYTFNQDSNIAATLGNPLVYDGATTLDDIYLFEDIATSKKGYLRSIVTGTRSTATQDGGKVATASLPGAVVIETTPTNPAVEDSTFTISLGSLSCDAADRR